MGWNDAASGTPATPSICQKYSLISNFHFDRNVQPLGAEVA
ncbi:Hypothetical protein AA314_05389 [Archangium gephyra]|uniref:Uncharacterized protein n=1 Tax=Archangium gephyra TaxID=48 RepID=A0AAC8TF83_9BACT|nr:Hypothetical protein AA314_05389 [Archangium gephyra]